MKVAVAVRKLFVLLLILILFPIDAQDNKRKSYIPEFDAAARVGAIRRELRAYEDYKQRLAARGQKMAEQGVLIETLDGTERLAEQNPDTPFNPASVTKLATSLAALSNFGPDYRFRTDFLADGDIDLAAHRLTGDLVVSGNNDPMFSQASIQQVASALTQVGITRVTGALRLSGSFTYFASGYHNRLEPVTSASKLLAGLRRAGIRIERGYSFGERLGTPLLSHYSDELVRILLFQNAHSSNPVAEVVGDAVGGPAQIQRFLVKNLGIPESDVFISRASGLDFNRITPDGSIKVLRALISLLEWYSLKPEDIMPVAGVDSGTLRSRFSNDFLRGSIIAKTGTLESIDGGVSTLVGIAHTKTGGTLLFAIFDCDGSVRGYRRLQDSLLTEVVAEEGGGVAVTRLMDGLAGFTSNSIVQIHYKVQSEGGSERLGD
jgi:D-alanyl-D-alanine carboxypeptidase/D-alanyl-D-alanine-endopeptidase (penicillin-binding protein 4)